MSAALRSTGVKRFGRGAQPQDPMATPMRHNPLHRWVAVRCLFLPMGGLPPRAGQRSIDLPQAIVPVFAAVDLT
jgi:hypothetical protein